MKLAMHGLREKTVNTSKGASKTFSFKSGDTWYSAFCGSWNADWVEGMEIEIPDDRIKVTTKGDATFHNIQAPPKSEQDAKKASDIQRVLSGLEAIWRELQVLKAEQKKIKEKLGIVEG